MIEKLNLPLGGGVDLHSDPAAIPDGNWARLRNLAPRMNGVVGRRHSLSFVRELEPSWWHWDARTGEGFIGIADAVPHYYRWAKSLRPLKFMFDPNFGNITMVAITTATVRVQSVTTAVENPAFDTQLRSATELDVEAGTMLLICLPGIMNMGSSHTEPVLRCAVLGPASRVPSLFTFDGTTYCIGGTGNGSSIVDSARTTSGVGDPGLPVSFDYMANYFGSANTDFNPDGAAVIRDRVVYFKGPNLYFSDRNAPLTVGSTGALDANSQVVPSGMRPPVGTNYPAIGLRDILVGGDELENITAIAALSTTSDGSPQQSVVAAWTNSSCYLILGEPLETTQGGDVIGSLQVNKLNTKAGCVSQDTVCRTPYGTFWCGKDDVWFMPFGTQPIRVGTKIRPYIENQPQGLLWRFHAQYSNGFYMLAMFKEGQGPNVYDPCQAHFWLNLKNGPPQDANQAQWFGPQEFTQTDNPYYTGVYGGTPGTYCMATDDRANGDGRMYVLNPFIIRDDTDSVVGMSLCSIDTVDDKDTTAPQKSVTAPWETGYTYYEGDELVPRPSATSLVSPVYVAITSGLSGATEPDWFTPAADGELVDGTVTWVVKYYDHNTSSILSGYDRPLGQEGATIGSYNNMIEWSALSREIVFEAEHEVLLDGAEIVATLGQATQLSYNTHPQQDSRSRVWTPNFGTLTTLGTTQLERYWQAKLLTPDPTKRFNALSGQLEISQDAGHVITAGLNDTWEMTVGGVVYTITITAGYYTNLYTLSQALKTAYATATGATLVTSLDAGGFNVKACFTLKDAANTLVLVTTGQLAQIFGFVPPQSPVSVAANVEAVSGVSPAIAKAPDMLLSSLKLRHGKFRRDPT